MRAACREPFGQGLREPPAPRQLRAVMRRSVQPCAVPVLAALPLASLLLGPLFTQEVSCNSVPTCPSGPPSKSHSRWMLAQFPGCRPEPFPLPPPVRSASSACHYAHSVGLATLAKTDCAPSTINQSRAQFALALQPLLPYNANPPPLTPLARQHLYGKSTNFFSHSISPAPSSLDNRPSLARRGRTG